MGLFDKGIGAIGGLAGGLLGGVGGGVNKLLSPFGLGGEQGAYATGPDYAAGDAALKSYSNFLKDPSASMDAATKGVQNDALTKGLFGQGGLQEQLGKEGQDLASRGYSLQQPDYEAYGQASGDIARQFGQQEQDASKMLARRGLGAANSGAAGATFSGIAGNKNEMLARAQTDIAQKRMADTNNRLLQNRTLQSSLAGQGNQMAQQRFSNTGKSLGENYNALSGNAQQKYENQRNVTSDQQGAQGQTLFGQVGKGVGGLVGNLGSVWSGGAAGKAAGAMGA